MTLAIPSCFLLPVSYIGTCDMASAASNINDDIPTASEIEYCTDSTQCCTVANDVPAAEMIVAACQVTQCDDKKTEIIIGKQVSLPIYW